MFPILFVVIVVVFALLAYHSYQQQQKRLAELNALAGELNWQFDSEEDYDFDSTFPQIAAFSHGGGRYAYNMLRGDIRVGDVAWPAKMGDYHYTTTSRRDDKTETHHHHFSFLLVELPYKSVPNLYIRREGFFDTIAGALGFDDIDFESVEFSKKFHVKSSDKKFAYDVCYPQMMEYLLATSPPTIELAEGVCCLTEDSATWSAAEFRERLNWAMKFFDLWPRHLIASLKDR